MSQLIESTTTNVTPQDMILNSQAMGQIVAFSEMMSQGRCTVPKHLQGNSADCMAIVMQSARWNMDPFAVAQKTHFVNGNLGYEAQLINAVITSSDAVVGRFHYEYGGDWEVSGDGSAQKSQSGVNVNMGNTINQTCWVRVGATLTGESDIQWGERLYPSMVTTKNSPLWKTNPKQQSAYLATKYWARLYAPSVIMGVYSSDEFEPTEQPTEKDITPKAESTQSSEPNKYSKDDFDKNLPKWKAWVEAGKGTPQGVIDKAQTKGELSSDMIAQINDIKVLETEA